MGAKFCASLPQVCSTHHWGPMEPSLAITCWKPEERRRLPFPLPEKLVGWLGPGLEPRGSRDNKPSHPGRLGQVMQLPLSACKQDFGPRTLSLGSPHSSPGTHATQLGGWHQEWTGHFLCPKGSQVAPGSLRKVPPRRVRAHGSCGDGGGGQPRGGSVCDGGGGVRLPAGSRTCELCGNLCLWLWSSPWSPAWE